MSSTAAAVTSPGAEHKPILAERFKTKMCRNFQVHGSCPYEQRCMFAHGEDDLRTKETNLRDQLTSEDAIKAFQRAKYAAKAREAMLAVAEESQTEDASSTDVIKRNADGSYSHNPYGRWAPFYEAPTSPTPVVESPRAPQMATNEFGHGWTTYGCTCPSCLHGVPMPPPPKYVPAETSGPRHKVLVP